MRYSSNQFSNKEGKTNLNWVSIVAILCIFSIVVGITIAFFYHDDWATSGIGTSGPVNILAVGKGDVSIEDENTCNLVIDIDDEYDVLIPGMPIDMTANCKVFYSSTHPLLRAMLNMTFVDIDNDTDFDEDSTYETSRLTIGNKLITQIDDMVEDNGWYLHTDGYYYYIGKGNSSAGGGTLIEEIDFPEGKDRVIKFINSYLTFPTETNSTYSGLGVKFEITFQAVQNYIPDENGDKLPNTIANSSKIFDYFESSKYEPTPLSYFTLTYNSAGTAATLNKANGVTLPSHLVLPSEDENGIPITSIANYFFENDSSVEDLIIPDSYTYLPWQAIRNNSIQYVDISQTNLTSLQGFCNGMSKLKTVKLNDKITLIQDSFNSCGSLKSIELPESLLNIKSSFRQTTLNALFIPKNCKEIEVGCFNDITFKITVDPDNQYFYSVEDSMLCSYSGEFIRCVTSYKNSELTIPDGIKTLRERSTSQCGNVTHINLPKTFESFAGGINTGRNALPWNLKTFTIVSGNTSIYTVTGHEIIYSKNDEMTIYVENGLTEYEVPSTVKSFTTYAFGVSLNTTSKIIFPSGITTISGIFCWGTNVKCIKEMYFPASVTSCGVFNTLNWHEWFNNLIFYSTTPPVMTTKPNTYYKGKIYVPDSAVSAYKASEYFANVVNNIYPISEMSA